MEEGIYRFTVIKRINRVLPGVRQREIIGLDRSSTISMFPDFDRSYLTLALYYTIHYLKSMCRLLNNSKLYMLSTLVCKFDSTILYQSR